MLNTSVYKCANCKLYLPQNKTCQIMIPQMQGKIEPNDFCSQHHPEIALCETCGAGVLIPFIEVIDEDAHIYCPNCLAQKKMQEDMQFQTQNP